jgi:hypothetical protein
MGHKHIDALKEIPSTTSQEHVEESADLEDSEDEVDGQATDERRADVLAPAPIIVQKKRSYAKVVKSRVSFQPRATVRHKCKRRKVLTPLTLRQ